MKLTKLIFPWVLFLSFLLNLHLHKVKNMCLLNLQQIQKCDFNRFKCVCWVGLLFSAGLVCRANCPGLPLIRGCVGALLVRHGLLHHGVWLQGKKAMMKFRNYMDNSQRPDTYQLPDINSYLTPIPPTPQPQAGKISRENRSEPWRRKRLRPITAPNGLEPLYTRVTMDQMFFYYCNTDDFTPAEF